MIKTRLKYCVFDPDPRGNPRYYVRVPGRPKIRIQEKFEDNQGRITESFMKAYFAALTLAEGPPKSKSTPRDKTFRWLLDQYYRSAEFSRFDPKTQADKRGVLNRYCDAGAGDLPYAAFRKADVERSRDKRAETPGAADKLVKYLRSLFNWAVAKQHATSNPAVGVEKINEGDGWHTWTSEEVAQYRARHAIGTKARLAVELMLSIGARRSDVCRVGRQHEIENGQRLSFVAWKGRGRAKTRKTITVRIEPHLRRAIEATAVGDTTYLVTDNGKAFTIAGFGNKMREWCDQAQLPDCSAHGLRKAAAVQFAESGASAPEMCAVFGWSKLETAEIYIREARATVMADNAFARLDDYRNRKSVSLLKDGTTDETK